MDSWIIKSLASLWRASKTMVFGQRDPFVHVAPALHLLLIPARNGDARPRSVRFDSRTLPGEIHGCGSADTFRGRFRAIDDSEYQAILAIPQCRACGAIRVTAVPRKKSPEPA
jgi:hypothetical protein